MTQAELLSLLQGNEMLAGDAVVVKLADGTSHAIAGITRIGIVETTLPSGIVDQPAYICIQLA